MSCFRGVNSSVYITISHCSKLSNVLNVTYGVTNAVIINDVMTHMCWYTRAGVSFKFAASVVDSRQ